MDQIFIRIPLKRIIAGDYKVGLTPRNRGNQMEKGVCQACRKELVSTSEGIRCTCGINKYAVSLPELVQETNAFSVKNRPGCTPILRNSNPKDLSLSYNVKCNLPDSDPSGHDVQVHFDISKVEETQKAKDLDVRCSCSCPAFLYWGAQWNLHQRDGLEGQPRPLLQAPTERLDLRNNFVICKHCKAVFERILPAVQHNVNNIIRTIEVKRTEKKWEEEGREPASIRRKQKPLAPKDEEVADKLREGLEKREREQLLKNQGIVKRSPLPEEEGLAVEEVEAPKEKAFQSPAPTPPEVKSPLEGDELEQEQEFLEQKQKEERGKLLRERHKLLQKKPKPGQTEVHPPKPHLHKGLPYKRVPPKKRSFLLMRAQ